MSELIKPGTDNKPAGLYQEVGPRGGEVTKPRVVSIDTGDRLPPTQKPGNKWKRIQFPQITSECPLTRYFVL